MDHKKCPDGVLLQNLWFGFALKPFPSEEFFFFFFPVAPPIVAFAVALMAVDIHRDRRGDMSAVQTHTFKPAEPERQAPNI